MCALYLTTKNQIYFISEVCQFLHILKTVDTVIHTKQFENPWIAIQGGKYFPESVGSTTRTGVQLWIDQLIGIIFHAGWMGGILNFLNLLGCGFPPLYSRHVLELIGLTARTGVQLWIDQLIGRILMGGILNFLNLYQRL